MSNHFLDHLQRQLDEIKDAGLYKSERLIDTPQGSHVNVAGQEQLLNLCSNNYLGLAQHPEVNLAAKQGLKK